MFICELNILLPIKICNIVLSCSNMIPNIINIKDELPKNNNGKVDKKKLILKK